MSSADLIHVQGTITKMHNAHSYEVTLDTGHRIAATLSGRLVRARINLTLADRVAVGLSPYDPTKGRIESRL